MDPKAFVFDTLERAGKTFVQVFVGFFTTGMAFTDLDWKQALSVAVTAAVVSVLSSVGSLPVGENGNASLVGAVRIQRGAHAVVAPDDAP